MSKTKQTDDDIAAAEAYAFNEGVPHTDRKEPAWHYSIIDFKAGIAHNRTESHKRIVKLEFALNRIADVTSAIHPGRSISFADWELRQIAKEALAADERESK